MSKLLFLCAKFRPVIPILSHFPNMNFRWNLVLVVKFQFPPIRGEEGECYPPSPCHHRRRA